MIKWIFFDVGGTILDEEPVLTFQENLIYELLNEHRLEVGEEEWASAIRAARSHYLPRYANHLIWIFTEDPALYERISLEFEHRVNRTGYRTYRKIMQVLPNMKSLLMDLSQRYSLGIICNQPAVTRQRLDEEGLLGLFQVHAISSEMDLRKPDLRFFLAALAMAKCQPDEAAMVGDRLDNDIYPARTLGMTAVRLKAGPHRHQPVLSPEYLPHYTVTSTQELAEFLVSADFVSKAHGAEMVW